MAILQEESNDIDVTTVPDSADPSTAHCIAYSVHSQHGVSVGDSDYAAVRH